LDLAAGEPVTDALQFMAGASTNVGSLVMAQPGLSMDGLQGDEAPLDQLLDAIAAGSGRRHAG
jgi:hypothetical protein